MAHNANEFHPVDVLYDGPLSASIYRGVDRLGSFYYVEFNRSGAIDGRFVTTKLFRQEQLLALSHLAKRAYDHVAHLKFEDAKAATPKPTLN